MGDKLEAGDGAAASASASEDMPPIVKSKSRPTQPLQLRSYTGTHHRRQQHARNQSLDETHSFRSPTGDDIGSMSDGHVDYHPREEKKEEEEEGVLPMPEDEFANGGPLPEFVAGGGGEGIFKVPSRFPVNPSRPPSLEVRPHPLRETQVGRFLRTIASTETQLWAGQETGVRVWSYSDMYEPGIGVGGRAARGDEDAAPFYESTSTSPATCLAVNPGGKFVYSGHKDGKIRCWKIDLKLSDHSTFEECLSWQAHKEPALSMEISCYGDIWTGSEGGHIKVWPWEAVERSLARNLEETSLSISVEEKATVCFWVEKAVIDLKSQVSSTGSNIPSSDVKCLLSDHGRGKVWAVGTQTFSLWYNCRYLLSML